MDEPGGYDAESSKPVLERQILHEFHLYEESKIVILIETE